MIVEGFNTTTNDRSDSGHESLLFLPRATLALTSLPNHVSPHMSDNVPASMAPVVLEEFLHAKIPLTSTMGIRVIETGRRLVLEAPLDANVNHLGTAFGGSLHTLPILACYSVVWTLLREAGLDGHVVVKHSAADYRQPVKGTLRAVCDRPAAETVTAFITDLRRLKKARMELSAIVEGTHGKPAVEFTGTFVALV
jgi:thioesterase domain-containing protein